MDSNKITLKPVSAILKAVLFWLSCAVALAASSGLTKSLSGWASAIAIGTAGVIAFLLTILFCKWQKLTLKDVGVVPGGSTARHLLIGVIVGALMVAVQVIATIIPGYVKLVYAPQVGPLIIGTNLLLYILIACREELVFRAFPLRSINYTAGPAIAQTVVVILFIIEHKVGGMTWIQAILGPGLGAILFGLAALKTKGLALPIGIHSAWNFGQWIMGFKNDTGLFRVITEKGHETIVMYLGWVGYILATGIAILVVYRSKVVN
ncbi:MAG: CPBP family intramembrane metalloprotease [Mucilaginibacter sp.]|nr:CPBP family intramembrane metalloprotease [Mucilaginibacter sp.]